MAKNFHSKKQQKAVKNAGKLQKQLSEGKLTDEEKDTIPPEAVKDEKARKRGMSKITVAATGELQQEVPEEMPPPPPAPIEPPKRTKIMSLKHEFTHEELESMGDQLVNCIEREKVLKLEANSSAAGFRKQIKDVQAERDRLSGNIKTKHQIISVECPVEFDFTAGVKHIIDPRDNSTIVTEKITPEERQLRFPEGSNE